MGDNLYKLFGAAILCIMLLVILRKESPDTALTARMVFGLILAFGSVAAILPIVEYISEIGESFGASEGLSDAVSVLLKALGVALLTHICSTLCKDSGEGSIAYYVELGGKIEIMLLSLPLLRGMLDMSLELLELN